mmetsp:Transcript_16189/g.26483  ORF Transcript_16189/g.26483 Transcript_16189/m.26483 type:complete len:164 (+) Transcript_16189:30-521(+)
MESWRTAAIERLQHDAAEQNEKEAIQSSLNSLEERLASCVESVRLLKVQIEEDNRSLEEERSTRERSHKELSAANESSKKQIDTLKEKLAAEEALRIKDREALSKQVQDLRERLAAEALSRKQERDLQLQTNLKNEQDKKDLRQQMQRITEKWLQMQLKDAHS